MTATGGTRAYDRPVEIVRSGTWRYAGSVDRPVDVVALPYDFWHELGAVDDQLEPGETPQPLGADGVLFYVRFQRAGELTTPTWPDSAGYPTIESAVQAAEARVPGGITWAEPTRGAAAPAG